MARPDMLYPSAPEDPALPTRRGASDGRTSLAPTKKAPISAQPSDLELKLVDFALNNKGTPTGIVEQSNGKETVRIEFQEVDGERVIKKVGVRRDNRSST